MTDRFRHFSSGLEGPATEAFNITPNNIVYFEQPTSWIWVGGGGNVAVELLSYNGQEENANNQVVYYNVPDGTKLTVRAKKVYESNTTATLLVGNY